MVSGTFGATGPYSMDVRLSDVRDAGFLPPGSLFVSSLDSPLQNDIWTVEVTPGGTYVVETRGLDTIVTIYDADLNRIANDDGGEAGGSLIEITVDTGQGVLLVEVRGYSDWVGDYKIEIFDLDNDN